MVPRREPREPPEPTGGLRTALGPYQLHGVIRRGRSGEVYRALDTASERVVALKLLATENADHEFRARFDRSCRIVRGMANPHVVPIHDHGEIEGRMFVAMRLVEGPDLATVLEREEVLAVPRAVGVLGGVASALSAAHALGLVHRNVKPSNVLLPRGESGIEQALLGDFGIVSRSGLSLDYTAPERFRGEPTDHREDVYALGCVLFVALTGSRPYPGRSLPERMRGHLEGEIPRPSERRPGVPEGLDAVVADALAKNAVDRFPTVGALVTAARAVVGLA